MDHFIQSTEYRLYRLVRVQSDYYRRLEDNLDDADIGPLVDVCNSTRANYNIAINSKESSQSVSQSVSLLE